MINRLLNVLLLGLMLIPAAQAAQDQLLPPDEAFAVSANPVDAKTVRVQWTIAEGYYLYRSKFSFASKTADITLGGPVIPPGKVKKDEFFGEVETYRKSVTVDIPLTRSPGSSSPLELVVGYQGCADLGVCYQPMKKTFSLPLPVTAAMPIASADPLKKLTQLGNTLGLGASDDQFLPPGQAFIFTADVKDASTIIARWDVADGYYMYRDKFKFAIADNEAVKLGKVDIAPGKIKDDPYIGKTEVYYHLAQAVIHLNRTSAAPATIDFSATYQGCADAGLCYPPQTKTVSLALPEASSITLSTSQTPVDDSSGQSSFVKSDNLLLAILGAFGIGLLLTFTPCVLPMIPILSSIIVGQGGAQSTKLSCGLLSLTYVMGTAVTYTAAGILAGWSGEQLQSYFQNAWAIGILSGILVLLALSMFGFYEIQMPSFIQSRLQEKSQRARGGSYIGVFLMGIFSAAIVGACVSPLLITVLSAAIISHDPVLGGAMMFALAMGMGVILILIGVGAGALLPKAGSWMDTVKHVFGIMLIGVAIYLLSILPEVPALLLWGVYLIITAVYLGATQTLPEGASGWRYLWKGIGTVLLIWGVLALLGGVMGNRVIMQPLGSPHMSIGRGSTSGPQAVVEDTHTLFVHLENTQQLDDELAKAKAAGKPVMLDYFATWCTDCLRMERATFSDPRVQKIMREKFVTLQVDVTDPNNADTEAIKQRFGVFGPPAMLFFSKDGSRQQHLEFYGFKKPDEFIEILNKI